MIKESEPDREILEAKKAIKAITKYIVDTYDGNGDYEEDLVARCNQAVTSLRKYNKRNSSDSKAIIDNELKNCFADFASILNEDISFIEKIYNLYSESGGKMNSS